MPLLAWALARSSGRRQAAARGELTAELVELLRGAPELVAYGQEDEALARVRAADAELVRLGRRDALAAGAADALMILVAGATVAGVLAVAVDAHAVGALDRVLVATLALLALASFDAVIPLPGAARELSGLLAAGRRVLETVEREPLVRDPAEPRPGSVRAGARRPRGSHRALRRRGAGPARLRPAARARAGASPWSAPAAPARPPCSTSCCASSTPRRAGSRSAGTTCASTARRTRARPSPWPARTRTCSTRPSARTCASRDPDAEEAELWAALQRARLAEWVASLPAGLDTQVGEEGTMLSGGQRQRLVLARALLAGAPVLLLDEPTAHLDPPTARALMDDVLAAAAGTAVLLVTHRPEGLDRMDEVVELARA